MVLPARGETLSNGWSLWWERAPDSFALAGHGYLFGRRGTLNAALDAGGFLVHEAGLDVTFSSPDNDQARLSHKAPRGLIPGLWQNRAPRERQK